MNESSGSLSTLPVLPGVSGPNGALAAGGRLHASGYVTALIRATHMIHNVEQLETAETIVESLNSSLTALIATDSFESMTLIKMSCVLIWLVHSSNEDFKVDRAALSDGEAQAARLSEELSAAAVLALLLPAYTLQAPPERALPALKVWLQWCVQHVEFVRGAAWRARAALWPALAHTLNALAPLAGHVTPHAASALWPALTLAPLAGHITPHAAALSLLLHTLVCDARAALWPALAHTLNALAPLAGHVTPHAAYETVPLPEDEELHGFLPLEEELKPLRFANHAAWDAYGGRVPDVPESAPDDDPPAEVPASCLSSEPELERRLRALRLVRLGRRLADMFPEHLQCNEEDGVRFTATSVGGEQLSAALAELSLARAAGGEGADEGEGEGEDDSDDEPERAPPPIVISEADFREKGE
ncbi:uncharacterized protein LOC135078068 [Ostrinia nubilalis]|uniref:uncharacterized protein LOC135078068 n=1 Tax=Ostrinia nubilalis TaxID=29057 RepID=UPI0030826610